MVNANLRFRSVHAGRFRFLRRLAFVAIGFLSTQPSIAMLYRPDLPVRMWDAWIFQDGDRYHLFHLAWNDDDPRSQEFKHKWTHIGHAVSKDLVHWEALPPIPSRSEAADDWDRAPTLTGTTVRSGDYYYLYYGSLINDALPRDEWRDTPIGLMTSTDGIRWERHLGNPLMDQSAPYSGFDWRDPFLHFDEASGTWHAFLTARAEPDELGLLPVAIAHLTSRDLIDWETHDPLFTSREFRPFEVPSYFAMNAHHYLTFNNWRGGGNLHPNTSGREDAFGTNYLIGESLEGPYRLPEHPLLLASGNGRKDNCIGRAFPTSEGILFYHNSMGGPTMLGSIKKIDQEPDGTLRLVWWPGMERLAAGKPWILERSSSDWKPEKESPSSWIREEGALTGSARRKPTACELPLTVADMMITVEIDLEPGSRAGVFWWGSDDAAEATGFLLDPSDQAASTVALTENQNPTRTTFLDRIQGEDLVPLREDSQEVRVLARGYRCEVYLNNRWMFSFSREGEETGDRIGLFVESGSATFHDIRVQLLEAFAATPIPELAEIVPPTR